MVGRPNFPEDVESRRALKGSAVGTPGLTALDEEREASLADEGGASGAYVESQDEDHLPVDGGGRSRGRISSLAMIAGAATAGALLALAFRRR